MNFGEYDYEPVLGLPGHLPRGEQVLWQGRPGWAPLARQALRIVPVAIYFSALALWRGLATWDNTHELLPTVRDASLLLGLGALAIGVLCLIAWAAARATVYTITSARIVIRHGIALQMSLNLPLARLQSASVAMHRDGTGDVALQLLRGERVGYFVTWPHVRPWHYLQPQPSLRALADVTAAAAALSRALAAEPAGARAAVAASAPGTATAPTAAVAA